MECYFLRHGPAADPAQWPGDDYDRPLTRDGRKRIEREAETLASLGLEFDAIVTSPLVRAVQTAAIIADVLKISERLVEDKRLGFGFDLDALETVLAERSGANTILLVGHEPSMSSTVGALIGDARIAFKKGALASVTLTGGASPPHKFLLR
jgi:phosphohistidine phosphatase